MRVFQKAAVVVGVALLNQSLANFVQQPVRSRFNAQLIRDLFHRDDQKMLEAFFNLQIHDVPVEGYVVPVRNEPEIEEKVEEPVKKEAKPVSDEPWVYVDYSLKFDGVEYEHEKAERLRLEELFEEKEKEPVIIRKETLDSENLLVQDIVCSLETASGVDPEAYDFELSLQDPELGGYLGFVGRNLFISGRGRLNGSETEFKFRGPVNELKMEVEMVPETSSDVIGHNEKGKVAQALPLVVEFGQLEFEDFDEKHPQADYIKAQLKEKMKLTFLDIYKNICEGNLKKLANLPLESVTLPLFLKHLNASSKEMKIGSEVVDVNFDPDTLLRSMRPAEFSQRKENFFKEINSEFNEKETRPLQVIIDENAINSFLLDFLFIDKWFSLREAHRHMAMTREIVLEMNPYIKLLTTSTVGILLPDLLPKNEGQEERPVDFYFTTSTELISEKFGPTTESGFQIDENGNYKLTVNLGLELLVEKLKYFHFDRWGSTRHIGMQFVTTGKVEVKEGASSEDRALVITPNGFELAKIKIFKEKGEVMFVEQQVIESGLNMQFQNMVKTFTPYEIPLYNIDNPKELRCLGIKLKDANVTFKNSYVEVSFNQTLVQPPSDQEDCKEFTTILTRGYEVVSKYVKNEVGIFKFPESWEKKVDFLYLEQDVEQRMERMKQKHLRGQPGYTGDDEPKPEENQDEEEFFPENEMVPEDAPVEVQKEV